ncbi:MAG: isochorismatase family protein [Planctomycetia bacterium]|nr:isochorismatase family protein [Planctomycetia bacterium]
MRRFNVFSVVLLLFSLACGLSTLAEPLSLQLRSRVPYTSDMNIGGFCAYEGFNDADYLFRYQTTEWEPSETALIICDMWNGHHCLDAVHRVEELVPQMNEVVKAAREKGVLIVHSPSDCMGAYRDTPARRRAIESKEKGTAAGLRAPASRWNRRAEGEPRQPIDDSDGGCDKSCRSEPTNPPWWTAQHPGLDIDQEKDIISDNDEIYYVFQERKIRNILFMGVHANMCVQGRPFGIRNLVKSGYNVVLVRDLTDSMYNPKKAPFVSHVRGTELVVGHIERYHCPTIVSSDLIGGKAFRFREDTRKKVVFLVSDDHYHADKTLPMLAEYLMDRYDFYCVVIHGEGRGKYRHFDELDDCNAFVIYQRRSEIPQVLAEKFLNLVKNPNQGCLGMRTASHGFETRTDASPGWRTFSVREMAELFGGNYANHGPDAAGSDVENVLNDKTHALLEGIEPAEWHSVGSQYYTLPLAEDSLLLQNSNENGRVEPLTWIRPSTESRARLAFTCLGHPADFNHPAGLSMIVRLIRWSAGE